MVWVILSCLASGDFFDDVLRAYLDLTREDIYATLSYAAELTRERIVTICFGEIMLV
jgi:uncharacterized protein (DUF433 family)